MRLWDHATAHEILRLNGHRARVNGIASSPAGDTLASIDHAGAIRLWRSSVR